MRGPSCAIVVVAAAAVGSNRGERKGRVRVRMVEETGGCDDDGGCGGGVEVVVVAVVVIGTLDTMLLGLLVLLPLL